MHAPKTFFLTSILALFSTTIAAPAPAVPEPCLIPAIVRSTIKSPFTLSAFTDEPNDIEWAVQLDPPSTTQATRPFISRSKIAQPIFRLTDGKLTTGGPNDDQFAAYFGPTLTIFPNPLQPLFFGGSNQPRPLEFEAVITCDAERNVYTKLRTTRRKFFFL